MKTRMMVLLLIFVLTLGIFQLKAEAGCLKVLTEEFPPFNYIEKGRVTGFSVDIVEELIKMTGVCIERDKILFWPWKRAYQAALGEPNVLLFTTTRNPQRETLFKWAGPVYPREQWLFKLKTRDDIQISSITEALNYKAVETNNSANYEYLLNNGFIPGQNLIAANFTASKIKMFLSGRADIAFFVPIEITYYVNRSKIKLEVERLNIRQGALFYYLAFSKKTPDSVVEKFQIALDVMIKNGTYKDILSRYMN